MITFRETLEAALVIGIILAYLAKANLRRYNHLIYLGVISGIIASILAAGIFNAVASGFTGRAEQIFEGVTRLAGALLLASMIFWMNKKHTSDKIREKITANTDNNNRIGLFFLAFFSVFREGVETVLFLGAADLSSHGNILSGVLGIASAVLLGFLIFAASVRINLKIFFSVTSLLLLLFAAGLLMHSVHEFEEAGVVPPIIEHVWDLNPVAPLSGSGIYPLLHEKGRIGSILSGFFGYVASPSLLQALIYMISLFFIVLYYTKV